MKQEINNKIVNHLFQNHEEFYSAYFLGLNDWVVNQNMTLYGLKNKRPKVQHAIKSFGMGRNHNILTYRLASQIYEACDLGFTLEETCELLDTTPQIVDYAIKHDKKIEADIVKALRILYKDKRVNRPYKKNDFWLLLNRRINKKWSSCNKE